MPRGRGSTSHVEKVNRGIKKLDVKLEKAKKNSDIAMLCNSLGYLVTVHNNIRKTIVIEQRIKDLEQLAGVTKKLMPDGSKFMHLI